MTVLLTLGLATVTAQAASGTWDTDLAGDWTDITKWLGDAAYATDADSTATFGNFISVDRIINLNAPITIGNITASDTTHNYTISGANILTLDRTDATAPTINVTGGRTLTISSQISGSDGLQKNGAGILLLNNINNNYTGGTILSAGSISFAGNVDSHLGATSGGLTFGGGQISYTDGFVLNRAVTVNANLALNNAITVNGVLSGTSSISQSGSDGANFANTGNTFTGTVTVDYSMTFASLGDSSNAYNFGDTSAGFTWTGGAKTFALRPFTLHTTGSGQIRSSGSGALVIQKDLAITGTAGARTLFLGGSYTGPGNQFAGSITNGTGSTVSLTKDGDASIWALSGTNTYTGATTLSVGGATVASSGTLIFQGIQALSPGTSLRATSSASNGGKVPGTFKILDDSVGTISRSGVNLFWSGANGQDPFTVFVGNNNTANGGTSAGTTTGSTIQLGNLNLTQTTGSASGLALDVTGANGYKLQIANVNITLLAATVANVNQKLNPTSAPLTVTGNVQQATGAGLLSTTTLQLDGTAAGNLISGNILNSLDGTPRVMLLSKAGTGDWTLSGTNSYTGATSINGGALRVNTGSGTRCASAVSIANTANCIFGVKLAAADGQWASSSTLTVAGANSEIEIDYGATAPSTTVDPIQVTTLTVTAAAGKLKILSSNISQFAVGNTYPLINGTTAVPANADPYTGLTLTLPTGVTGKLVTIANHVNLVITGNTAKSWNSGDANWDTGTPWSLAGTPAAFVATDTVYLGDSPSVSGNPTINVSGASVSPTAVIMNSANHDYTIAGNAIAAGTVTVNAPSRTLTLSSANTYSGATTITKGTLRAGVATVPATSGAFGNTSPVTLANDATAVLDLNGYNNTIASLSGGGGFGGNVVLGSATLTTGGGTTYAGVISGGGGLTKSGSGTLTLTGVNTFTGNISISGGTLQIGVNGTANGAKLGGSGGNYAGNISVATGSNLDFQTDANQTLSGIISGGGNLLKRYIGKLTLSGNNTYTGKTTLGAITNSGSPTLEVYSFNSVSTPMAFSSLGRPTTEANGTIQLGSNNSSPNPVLRYIGTGETTDRVINFTFNSNAIRTLDASGPSGLLKFTSSFTGGGGTTAPLLLTGTGAGEIAGNIPFSNGTITKSGDGTWTLSGTNSYMGATTISGGTLIGVVGGSCSNSAVTVAASANLGIRVTDETKQWTCKDLTFAAASANLKFAFDVNGSATLAPLNITGTLAFTGVPTVVVDSTNLVGGDYPLLTVAGTCPVTVPPLSIIGSLSGTLEWRSKTLYLVTPPPMAVGTVLSIR